MNQFKPQVIFLDAVGTLFGVAGSVGEIYGKMALKLGIKTDFQQLNQTFYQSFKNAPPLAFYNFNKNEISQLEFAWWQEIVSQTFTKVGVKEQFSNFEQFFAEMYAYFASAEPWNLYPDTITSLKTWQKKGIELGIISNFDSRIYQVLKLLELNDYFTSITISSYTGFAKPNSQIFKIAIAKHKCDYDQVWHIGDSLKEDYYAAKSLGIKSFLIQR